MHIHGHAKLKNILISNSAASFDTECKNVNALHQSLQIPFYALRAGSCVFFVCISISKYNHGLLYGLKIQNV